MTMNGVLESGIPAMARANASGSKGIIGFVGLAANGGNDCGR
ncbi:hypothetical protein [Rhizobium lusitanum]|uniref:Uncharacterized protein n=1 Tax=Rhizobium lusitanum TaxID=293958 RepID=A0A7X0MFD2_9HYPH|nr:hypothetical protein [Rhizobium lusitanum]MBB6488634.1 hypothetical protein [Rhizobium lusitanum]